MGMILSIGGTIAAVIAGTVSRFLADEAKAWIPTLIEELIKRAVARLPEDQKERYYEEWHSHLSEVPGDLAKLVVAFGYQRAASGITRLDSRRAFSRRMRSELDRLIGVLILIICLPMFAIIAVLIKLNSKGPIFTRVPEKMKDGRYFMRLAFRTFYFVNGDIELRRLTFIGRILHRFDLDRMAEVFDLIRGRVTVFRPRP